MDTTVIRCPVCGGALHMGDKAAVCPSGHSFDRAKQGYVNLLGSQSSSVKHHGDDRLMVRARRCFLEKGYYASLRDAVADAAVKYAPEKCALLDAGCGEGYYTEGVYRALSDAGRDARVFAADISKDAAKLASARHFPQTVAVASVFSLPVADGSCDMVLSIFAPVAADEFRRVLRPGGVLIRVAPRERHLFGLKSVIYDEPYLNPPVDQTLDGFEPLSLTPADWLLRLDSREDIDALFKMTPYYYKTSAADQLRAEKADSLTTELSFAIMADRVRA